MRDIRFNISLYVIIPIIIAGIAILATIATFNITDYYFKRSMDPSWPVAFWGTIMILVTAIFGILIVKFIIDPMKRFERNTENLGVISRTKEEKLKICAEQGNDNCELILQFHDECFRASYKSKYKTRAFNLRDYNNCIQNKIEQSINAIEK